MSSSFRRTVEKLAEQAGEGDRRPCNRCETPTAIATLTQYGGRCFGCFEDFCAAAFAPRPLAYDTVQQAEMRSRVKASSKVPLRATAGELAELSANARRLAQHLGKPLASSEDDAAARDLAKAAAERKVRDYAAKFGIPLEQSEAIHYREERRA